VLASLDVALGNCGSEDDEGNDEENDEDHDEDHGRPHDRNRGDDEDPGRCKPELAWKRFEAPAATPVLVCIDAQRASALWVSLNDHLVATPRDLNGDPLHLEIGAEVGAGTGWVSALLEGRSGATLRVRVLAGAGAGGGAGQGGTDVEPPSVHKHHGCETTGGAPLLSLLGLLGLRRGRRRA
jgi:hypothetical protein